MSDDAIIEELKEELESLRIFFRTMNEKRHTKGLTKEDQDRYDFARRDSKAFIQKLKELRGG